MGEDRYNLNMGMLGFLLIVKVFLLLYTFILLYLVDTGRYTEGYKALIDLALSNFVIVVLLIYYIIDLIYDICKRYNVYNKVKSYFIKR